MRNFILGVATGCYLMASFAAQSRELIVISLVLAALTTTWCAYCAGRDEASEDRAIQAALDALHQAGWDNRVLDVLGRAGLKIVEK